MKHESMNSIERAIAGALKCAPDTDDISAEQVIQLAELGRKHPRFDELMARVSLSPSALSIYRSARMTRPATGLKRIADTWREGTQELPKWFSELFGRMQQTPMPAYRSAMPQLETPVLVDPDPVNQSVFPGQEWRTAMGGKGILVTVDDHELQPDEDLHGGQVVTVTVTDASNWSLADEACYRFRVLAEEDVSKALWAKDHMELAPVACSLTFFMVGRFSDAERLLDRWPDDPELAEFANLIRHTAQARRGDARQFYV